MENIGDVLFDPLQCIKKCDCFKFIFVPEKKEAVRKSIRKKTMPKWLLE